jgi:hypothetical protein
MNPLSSRKMMLRFSFLAFFYMWPSFLTPSLNLLLIPFLAPPLRLLATPTTSVENLPDVGRVISYTKASLDYLGYPWQCPQLIFIPMSKRLFQK